MVDPAAPWQYAVIEVNARPGFSKYGSLGDEQKDRVIDIYRKCVEFAMSA
jgi:hypothetical protein